MNRIKRFAKVNAKETGFSLKIVIAGGTYAYFSFGQETNNTLVAGTLDLAVDPTTAIEVDNLKPGDWVIRDFELQNKGTLDIDFNTNK